MNKETLEHLSSLMDGELSNETGVFLTRRLGSDEELGDKWERFHLIRECMRRPGEQWVLSELSVDIDGIEEELSQPSNQRGMPSWAKPVSGFAVAASVALVAILVTLNGTGTSATQSEPGSFTSPNALSTIPLSQPASFNSSRTTAEQQRLNSYLLRHNQVAGSVGQQGFISFVPMVTTSAVQVVEPGEAAATDEPASSTKDVDASTDN